MISVNYHYCHCPFNSSRNDFCYRLQRPQGFEFWASLGRFKVRGSRALRTLLLFVAVVS